VTIGNVIGVSYVERNNKHNRLDSKMTSYNKEAVEKAIKTSRKLISKKEAKLIHALLKGRKV
tara:strand:+ start:571 stop:756 length:186 start_codon:yes stop_codon:yes gene_type:complete